MIHVFMSFLYYIKHFKKHVYSSIIHIFLTTFHTGFITFFIKNFSMITTHNTFWKPPVSILRSIKMLIHLTRETGSCWNSVCCDNGYHNKCVWQKPENGLAVIPPHMLLSLIKILFFKVKCFNVAFPLRQRNFIERKASTNGLLLVLL
jgi:hypothetical protein